MRLVNLAENDDLTTFAIGILFFKLVALVSYLDFYVIFIYQRIWQNHIQVLQCFGFCFFFVLSWIF